MPSESYSAQRQAPQPHQGKLLVLVNQNEGISLKTEVQPKDPAVNHLPVPVGHKIRQTEIGQPGLWQRIALIIDSALGIVAYCICSAMDKRQPRHGLNSEMRGFKRGVNSY